MIDLETSGKTAGCGIISIGAVSFSLDMPETEWIKWYSGTITRDSNLMVGLVEHIDTIDWWKLQKEEAKVVFDDYNLNRGISIRQALLDFKTVYPIGACLWGNGSEFDNSILSAAYYLAGIAQPWTHRDNRCYRTIKSLSKVPKPDFVGIRHNALDDAFNQARHLVKILESVNV